MRFLTIATLVVGALVLAPLGEPSPDATCAGADPYITSWADGRHAWQIRLDARGGCTDRLWSTENGGRTWHLVYRGRFGPLGTVVERTSARAGVIFPARLERTRARALWTNDNGRHWHRTGEIGQRSNPVFAVHGRGRLLFWVTTRALYRVDRWPSRRQRARRVFAPRGSARLFAMSGVPWFTLAGVPGGVATVVGTGAPPTPYETGDDPRLALLVHRNGRNRVTRLPGVRAALESIGADGIDPLEGVRVSASWPRVAVGTVAVHTGRGRYKQIAIGCVVWRSNDGGATWRVEAFGPRSGMRPPEACRYDPES